MSGFSPSDIDLQVIRAKDLTPILWKNGGGTTREIALQPPGATFDTFLWRVSMADVGQAGPFSTFDGIDRIIVITQDATMMLTSPSPGLEHALLPGEPFRFPGEMPIHARLPDGPTRDFNLMWRRDSAQGQMTVRRGAECQELNAGSAVLHCAKGSYRVNLPYDPSANYLLQQGDTLRLTLPASATLSLDIMPLDPDAVLLDCRIAPVPAHTIRPEPRP